MIDIICYICHKFENDHDDIENAKKILNKLQVSNTDDCYICPLINFQDLLFNKISKDALDNLFLDLLSVSDKLIVASEISEGVQREIDFANLVGMEVGYLEADT